MYGCSQRRTNGWWKWWNTTRAYLCLLLTLTVVADGIFLISKEVSTKLTVVRQHHWKCMNEIRGSYVVDLMASEYRHKAIPLDVTYADPPAGIHMRARSADRDGSAASTSEARKRSHYARLG